VDVKSFCESAGNDLIGWKAKLYDAIRKAETLGNVDKGKVEPLLKELNGLVDDVDKHIKLLADECPLDWESQKSEIQEKLSHVDTKLKALDGAMDVWNMNLQKSR
jgi:hypothetical protein